MWTKMAIIRNCGIATFTIGHTNMLRFYMFFVLKFFNEQSVGLILFKFQNFLFKINAI